MQMVRMKHTTPNTPSRCAGKPPAPCGFTLIELLVVVSIIALLIGIMLPALGQARDASHSAICLSQQRQMTIAAESYTANHHGLFPPAYGYGFEGTTTFHFAWDLTTVKRPGQPDEVIPGVLWQDGGVTQIQQCPAYDGPANWLLDPYTGYNYNTSFIGRGHFEAIPRPARRDELRQPSRTALFGDGQYSGGANKFMRAPFPNPADETFSGRWAGTQGFRHQNRTLVAFADGHVRSHADRFTDNSDDPTMVAEGTGFLGPDNALYSLEKP